MSEEDIFEKLKYKITVDDLGTKRYLNSNNELHRIDGPAVIFPDGEVLWCVNGRLHREDGPAIINASGSQFWYYCGLLHRDDGPAIIYNNGDEEWYRNGIRIND